MSFLNRAFKTDVTLINSFLEKADLADDSFDRVFSISTLEHIPAPECYELAAGLARVLKPGGRMVLTIDLFLNLEPFTDRTQNRYGTNLDVRKFVECSGLTLAQGEPAQLNGYPEFDPQQVQRDLGNYFLSDYPALTQMIVLTK